ncbi:MAG: DUF6528 family protein [Sphingobacteriaceae bacterium]
MTTLFLVTALLFSGCGKSQPDGPAHAEKEDENPPVTTPCTNCPVVATNQSENTVEVYDPSVADWNTAAAKIWSWKPTVALGYSTAEIGKWSNVSDAKLRNTTIWPGTTQVVLTTASGGLISIVSYPAGENKWAMNVGGNPHSAELLPNGNIATASSTGGYVRIYASSQGSTNNTYAHFNLPDAHGVLWDPANSLLWALGKELLCAFTIGGTDANPTITEVVSRRTAITGIGHDLSPYYGDLNKLWITSSNDVWIYNKATKTLTNAPGAAYREKVKAVSNQPSNDQIVQTKPRSSCSQNTWCTAYVEFYNGTTGKLEMTKYVSGAAFYKARVFQPAYQ